MPVVLTALVAPRLPGKVEISTPLTCCLGLASAEVVTHLSVVSIMVMTRLGILLLISLKLSLVSSSLIMNL